MLELRRRGLAVLLVHHDGKGGAQRGTSKREDILSQVVQLTRPAEYSPAAGAQFEVHLRKARGVFGEAARPFEAEYRTDENGRAVWAWKPIEDELTEQVLHLKRDKDFKQRQIRDVLGIGLGTVNRRIKKLEDEGRLPPEDDELAGPTETGLFHCSTPRAWNSGTRGTPAEQPWNRRSSESQNRSQN